MNGRCLHSFNLLPKEGGERFKLFTLHPQKISFFYNTVDVLPSLLLSFSFHNFLNHATSASSAIVNIR
jgi:hypothetical protein